MAAILPPRQAQAVLPARDIQFRSSSLTKSSDWARRHSPALEWSQNVDGGADLCDWREDVGLAHLSDVSEAARILDADEDAQERRFTLTSENLADLLRLNRISVPNANTVVVALRGCVAQDRGDMGVWSSAVSLSVVRPDYLRPRCVWVIWQREAERVAVFMGSTVPNREALMRQAGAFQLALGVRKTHVWRIANMLFCGLHTYRRGPHGGWHPAALRSSDARFRDMAQPVVRSRSGLMRLSDSYLDFALVMDNIHPAHTPHERYGAEFSSDGCLTISERQPKGYPDIYPADWARFISLLKPSSRSLAHVVIVPGVEAALAVAGKGVGCLRYGSSGPDVAAFRMSLGIRQGQVFDARTLFQYVSRIGVDAPLGVPCAVSLPA